MSRETIVTYDAQGNVVSTTVVSRPGCGCGTVFTVLLVVFVVYAPAYYAAAGQWPLGWVGAVLAYLVEAALIVGAIVAAVGRARRG